MRVTDTRVSVLPATDFNLLIASKDFDVRGNWKRFFFIFRQMSMIEQNGRGGVMEDPHDAGILLIS